MSTHTMRGTSAHSLEAVLATVASASQVDGDQLFAVVAVLDANPALRRVLSDPSTESAAKVGLVRQVFGQVGEGARAVVESAVAGRWAAARDLTDGLEIAGVSAWTAAAAAEGTLDRLEDELFAVDQTIHTHADLRSVISDKAAPVEGKKSLVADVFGAQVATATLALVKQAVVARTGSFERVIAAFTEQVARSRGRIVAVVRVAYELDETERARLAAALKAKYGSDIQLNFVVDPGVVGGIAVSVGDESIDATMSTRLEAARRQLAG